MREGFTWTTFIAFLPLLLCPLAMGMMMGQMCKEDKNCKKSDNKKCH